MKVYITGGTGFIGSHLAQKLTEKQHQVTVGSRKPRNLPERIPQSVKTDKIDITKPETIDFTDQDIVIHLVGLSPIFKPSVPYHKVHVKGTENVVKKCRETKTRLIHMSALGASTNENTEYLKTKGEAQEKVENSNLEWTIIRPSVIFGEDGEFLNFTEKLLTPYITALPGGGKNKFQPIHVEDISDLIIETVEDRKHIHKIYDLGGPEIHSMKEIAKIIEKSKDRDLKVIPIPMFLVKVTMTITDKLGLKYGLDQYRSLKKDNITTENSIKDFEKSKDELKTLNEYLRQ